jgi:hypothetical protein
MSRLGGKCSVGFREPNVQKSGHWLAHVDVAAPGPIVAVSGPGFERLLQRILDVPINLLELNSRDDAAGKAGAVQFPVRGSLPEFTS